MIDMIAQLAAELDGHSVTDEQGNITESETVEQEAAPVEQTTEDDTTTQVEKPAESEEVETQSTEDDEEIPVEDESGKKYVPENRFKKVYAEKKAMERELEAYKKQIEQGEQILNTPKGKKIPETAIPIDKADVLELKISLPQFNPDHADYDPDLDDLGFTIWKANGGKMSILQAAKEAIKVQSNIAKKVSGVKQEVRQIKAQQSDQGIATKVISRSNEKVDVDKMTDRELEAYLKANGQW